ncbi:MAG TPA: CPBP family intramembrane glutamic endopeptidase [Terracidiphilus sp.]|jgi:hypothetical protein|nr:CPBP family intramembrane glutamic endopeptidase [Terracidiphilus sp.]
MEPENPTPAPAVPPDPQQSLFARDGALAPQAAGPDGIRWVFMGPQGLRAGWSVLIFIALFIAFASAINFGVKLAHVAPPDRKTLTPQLAFFGELFQVLLLLLITFIVSRIERRKLGDYNLRGPRRLAHFGGGLITGFLALSALVAGLSAGGWLHLGSIALHGSQILLYAGAWGATFFLVGCFEEGTMRCYMLYTFTRGINFWWAGGITGAVCVRMIVAGKGNGVWGVYAIALLGLLPCLWLQLKKAEATGFWCAAWVTSTLFGAVHTGNNGETWIGVFSAAGIGFVFCASVRLTGSVWWAIGCHAAWDWAETYFYGTADSGLMAKGQLFTATPAGDPLWSGGTTGPEGSLLVIPIMLLILLVLVVFYGRKRQAAVPAPLAEQAAG